MCGASGDAFPADGGQHPPSAQELIARIKTQERSIRDLTLEYELHWHPEATDVTPRERIRRTSEESGIAIENIGIVIAERGSWRVMEPIGRFVRYDVDRQSVNAASSRSRERKTIARKGDRWKTLTFASGGVGDGLTMGEIKKGTTPDRAFALTPAVFTVFHFDYTSMSDVLRNGLFEIRPEPKEVQRHPCVAAYCAPRQRQGMLIYFSLDHGLTPIRFELINWFRPTMPPYVTYEVLQLDEIHPGVFLPLSGVRYGREGEADFVIEVKSANLNSGLTEDDFDIEFPAGTRVRDSVRGVTYTVAPGSDDIDTMRPDL